MSDLYKFGWFPDGANEERYDCPNTWLREKTSGPDRLVIAPKSHQTQLLEQLLGCLPEPYLLLYVLVVPRGIGEPGRYESNYSYTMPQLQQFIAVYSDFFENDARHNLWIRSVSGDGLLVYDRHNVIYAYGPIEHFVAALTSAGLTESKDTRLHFHSPHVHHYHADFDAYEDRILHQEEWSLTPLLPGDENPD